MLKIKIFGILSTIILLMTVISPVVNQEHLIIKEIEEKNNYKNVVLSDCPCEGGIPPTINYQNDLLSNYNDDPLTRLISINNGIFNEIFDSHFSTISILYKQDTYINEPGAYYGLNYLDQPYQIDIDYVIEIDINKNDFDDVVPPELFDQFLIETANFHPVASIAFGSLITDIGNVHVGIINYGWESLDEQYDIPYFLMIPFMNIDQLLDDLDLSYDDIPYDEYDLESIDPENTHDELPDSIIPCVACRFTGEIICPGDPIVKTALQINEDEYKACRKNALIDMIECMINEIIGSLEDLLKGNLINLFCKMVVKRFHLPSQICDELKSLKELYDFLFNLFSGDPWEVIKTILGTINQLAGVLMGLLACYDEYLADLKRCLEDYTWGINNAFAAACCQLYGLPSDCWKWANKRDVRRL